MDKTTVIGLIVGLTAVFGGALLDGTPLTSLVSVPAFVIVILGTLGATVVSNPMENLKRLPALLRGAFFDKAQRGGELVELFVELATRARKDGVLSLEGEIKNLPDPFLRKGIQLVVDGTDEEVIKEVLEADIEATAERHASGYAMFEMMGGYSPTLGIIGAVLGLIHVLSKVDDPTKLAAGIAVAFVATLYGVSTANLIYLPIGSKLRLKSEEEQRRGRIILQGILAIQAGDNPRVIRDKLDVFLAPKHRAGAAGAKKASAPAGAAAAGEAA